MEIKVPRPPVRRYDSVLFDLLTALLDSWTLWNEVAGDAVAGRRWRLRYLELTYAVGAYRPYESMVAEAAGTSGLDRPHQRRPFHRLVAEAAGTSGFDRSLGEVLAARHSELGPWPGVVHALRPLVAAGVKLGVATSCSERLRQVAAACVGVPFEVVVTAERAGFYKPDVRPYRLTVAELGAEPERCLFVAGSPYDLIGASRAGLAVWWHDRIGIEKPPGAPEPLRHTRTLEEIGAFVLGE